MRKDSDVETCPPPLVRFCITEDLAVATATASLPNSSQLLRLESWYFEGKSAIARSSGCTLHVKRNSRFQER